MTLEVKELTGGYGQVSVLKKETFNVESGQVVGLIGLNGAGKSTTIKHIIGLLTPRGGQILIDGISLHDDVEKYRKKIAYVPEMPILYPELTLREHIDLTIMAYGLDHDKTWANATELLKTFRLDNKLDWFPQNFSKGMKQKVMIVCAFMTDASLFIIDEPFTGLDPLAVNDLLNIVEAKKRAGCSVLMSTHVLATVQNHADKFVLINHGQVRADGTLDQLKAKFNMQQDSNLDDIYIKMSHEDL
ncbi:ABC transporter ATP-binding protein [Companilactobacillus bobalius]|uniref:Sulfate-transporting ATPase n=2 Tax=Companilactobacillus bobalius TaxID=2801451 RepID=A0A202F6P2_9LACO|nr:ABC transporter ATP-binding protein [Companilactobacillus bobalius]KAE9558475.1 multidrug ABC transporter ATP-binding protein [Companilactobacillus bobalius]KRK83750.1 drug ABC exporter, ATP-binding subunit [Companilactobacillus bobalius DSM 19674]OVE96152.1 Sulfate-transporting ATPase [Companilactobacillus bobalius]GEO58167.1 multidrug ABC transporter ATP-binding protein [Companilactobacillus paralimentarius]